LAGTKIECNQQHAMLMARGFLTCLLVLTVCLRAVRFTIHVCTSAVHTFFVSPIVAAFISLAFNEEAAMPSSLRSGKRGKRQIKLHAHHAGAQTTRFFFVASFYVISSA
jgi:hypothetical protein